MAKQAQKIFSDQVTEFGGGMKAGEGLKLIFQTVNQDNTGKLSWGTAHSTTGLIVQQISIQTQRPLQIIYDLTSKYAYYSAGRVQTSATVEKIVAPLGVVLEFYSTFGDVCNGAFNLVWFIIQPKKCTLSWAGSKTIAGGSGGHNIVEVQSMLLSGVGVAASVQNFMITETCQMQGLDVRTLYLDLDAEAVKAAGGGTALGHQLNAIKADAGTSDLVYGNALP
jgi:hypothetical protein